MPTLNSLEIAQTQEIPESEYSSLTRVELQAELDKMNSEVALPFKIDNIEVAISTSIGISLYPDNGVTAEELIRSADKAMYQVKRLGKNSFGFVGSVGL